MRCEISTFIFSSASPGGIRGSSSSLRGERGKKNVWEKKNQARLRAGTNTNVKPVRVFCRRSTRYLLTLLTYRLPSSRLGHEATVLRQVLFVIVLHLSDYLLAGSLTFNHGHGRILVHVSEDSSSSDRFPRAGFSFAAVILPLFWLEFLLDHRLCGFCNSFCFPGWGCKRQTQPPTWTTSAVFMSGSSLVTCLACLNLPLSPMPTWPTGSLRHVSQPPVKVAAWGRVQHVRRCAEATIHFPFQKLRSTAAAFIFFSSFHFRRVGVHFTISRARKHPSRLALLRSLMME